MGTPASAGPSTGSSLSLVMVVEDPQGERSPELANFSPHHSPYVTNPEGFGTP